MTGDSVSTWNRMVQLERDLARVRADFRSSQEHPELIRAALSGDGWSAATACAYLEKFTDEVPVVVPLLVRLALGERSRLAASSCLLLARHRTGVLASVRSEVVNLPVDDEVALRRGAELLWELGDREGLQILQSRIGSGAVSPAVNELRRDLDGWGE